MIPDDKRIGLSLIAVICGLKALRVEILFMIEADKQGVAIG